MSQEAETKRERRIASREDRKRRSAIAQRNARIRQIVFVVLAVAILVGIVVAAVTTSMFGLISSNPTVGRQVPVEGSDHVADGTPVTYKTRPPASGPHYSTWLQSYGFMDPAPPTGNWLHNLEHGAVAILYNCPSGCPELVQELKDLYPQLPLGRNAVRGAARALIMPYPDMDRKIAVVAWGWVLEQDELDRDQIIQFYESRIDRGPECRNFACP